MSKVKMMNVFKDNAISMAPLSNRTVAMIGYGNQGKPQALNLRDSGIKVVIGVREGSAKMETAEADGFTVLPLEKAVSHAEVVMMMVPDEVMKTVFDSQIAPYMSPGDYLGFSHGMAIHAGWVHPSSTINTFLLAPKAQGRGVRNRYVEGSGVPGLVAIHQDPSGDTLDVALAYGKAIGCSRAGILKTTFAHETETDLFSEQTILCGGLTQLIKTGFEVLVEHGYSPEVAYFECLYEVKLIADLLQEGGITHMRQKISSTALFGDLSQGPHVIDGHVKENMRRVLHQIQSGVFAERFLNEVNHDRPLMRERLESDNQHALERTGRQLREWGVLKQP